GISGIPAQDEPRLLISLVPSAQLDEDPAHVDRNRHGIGQELLRPGELAPRVAEPGLCRIGAAQRMQGRSELRIDLEGIAELDDGFVELRLLRVALATLECLLLLLVRTQR